MINSSEHAGETQVHCGKGHDIAVAVAAVVVTVGNPAVVVVVIDMVDVV